MEAHEYLTLRRVEDGHAWHRGLRELVILTGLPIGSSVFALAEK